MMLKKKSTKLGTKIEMKINMNMAVGFVKKKPYINYPRGR